MQTRRGSSRPGGDPRQISMETQKVDLAVIGAGPAGQKGAIQGAKAGRQVVIAVDRLGAEARRQWRVAISVSGAQVDGRSLVVGAQQIFGA